jgi:Pretoxin HINT domain
MEARNFCVCDKGRFVMRTDRVRGMFVFCSAAGFLVCVLTRISIAEEAGQQPVPEAKSAAQLVRAALESEAAGHLDQRAANLRDALAADPSYPPAHWHMGQVLIDGQWRSVVEEAESNGAVVNRHVGRLEQYRELRETMSPTLAVHLRLARFCREAGLADQERLHLSAVLRLDRNNKEAITRLRTPKRPPDPKAAAHQAAAIADAKRKRSETLARWRDQLTRLRDDFASDDAQRRAAAKAKLLAIRDVDAIPALESTVSGSSKEAAQLVVTILENMPSAPATVSLAKHAVLSEWPEVREKAALALKPRDLFAYVPPLLAHLAMPIEVSFDVGSRYGGAVGHHLELFQEGPSFDRSFTESAVYTPEPVPALPGVPRVENNGASVLPPAPGQLRYSVRSFRPPIEQSAAKGAEIADRVARYNQRTKQLNKRIAFTLASATGRELSTDPRTWWTWWFDYNELYYPETKPVYETTQYYSTPYRINQYRTQSCFVAGTPVWTQSGPISVEKLLVGEYVLSQDALTGELGYRPVMATTVRPPARTLAVKLAGDEILVTRGHPFWVAGSGWRMAKELKEGDLLHTPAGACAIERIEERSEYPTYNLVVAGFDSYFVGKNQVLVHDNNIREATPTVVPGLAR